MTSGIKCFKRKQNEKKHMTTKTKKWLFYSCLIAIPLIQFIIFYVCVNINSILLAFKEYDFNSGKYIFTGFDNFANFISNLSKGSVLKNAFKNSLLLYFFGTMTGTVLSIIFSYYIFKKRFLSPFFKVILFLPSIISSIVLVIMFKYFVERAVPGIWQLLFNKKIEGPLSNVKTIFGTIIFYNVWIGFGTQMLLYTGAMGQISESVIESAELEGVNMLQEIWYIILPGIFPTITTYLVVGVASIFINQGNLYSFYNSAAELETYTLGYYIFVKVIGENASLSEYPYAASAGLLFTMIAVPLTLLVKYLLEKYGPREE